MISSRRLILPSCFILCLGFFLGQDIPFEEGIELLNIILTSSSLIFAIIGIWLALVFPDVMNNTYKEINLSNRKREMERAERILQPLIYASMIFLTSFMLRLIIGVLKYKKEHLPFLESIEPFLQSLLFSVILLLSFFLILTLVSTLAPGFELLYKSKNKLNQDLQKNRLLSRRKKNR